MYSSFFSVSLCGCRRAHLVWTWKKHTTHTFCRHFRRNPEFLRRLQSLPRPGCTIQWVFCHGCVMESVVQQSSVTPTMLAETRLVLSNVRCRGQQAFGVHENIKQTAPPPYIYSSRRPRWNWANLLFGETSKRVHIYISWFSKG